MNFVKEIYNLVIDKTRLGKARQGKARQGKARQGKARQGYPFLIITLVATTTFYYFYLQLQNKYSDIYQHLITPAYSLQQYIYNALYFIKNLINKNIKVNFPIVALIIALEVIITIFVINLYINHLKNIKNIESKNYISCLPLTAIILFIGTPFFCEVLNVHYIARNILFGDNGELVRKYFGTILTQPWHSDTYILMRLFGFAVLDYFLLHYEDFYLKYNVFSIINLVILLILVNFAKPNFAISFYPTVFIFAIFEFVKHKFKNLKTLIIFGISLFISCLIMLFQYIILFPVDGDSSIIFSTINLQYYKNNINYVYILIAEILYPFIVLLISIQKKIDIKKLFFTWFMFLISFFQANCIGETGRRVFHGNFGWGVRFFSLNLYVVSFVYLLNLYRDKRISLLTFILINLLFLYCFGSGLYYFLKLINGSSYAI